MRCIIIVFLVFLSVSVQAKKHKEKHEKSSGLCLDSYTTSAICLAGSNLAEKMPDALNTCLASSKRFNPGKPEYGRNGHSRPDYERHGHSGQSRRGHGYKRCPSFDKLMSKLNYRFKDKSCVLMSLGWLDQNGERNNQTIQEDVNSLNTGVQSGLDQNIIEICTQSTANKLIWKQRKCNWKYSAEQINQINAIVTETSRFKCLTKNFMDACKTFIKLEYVTPLIQSLYPITTITGAVTTGAVTTGAVTTGVVTTGAVTTDAVTTGAVTTGAVTTGAVTTGAVTTDAVTTGAVTTGAVTTGAVTTGAVTNGAVTTGAVTTGAVTTDAVTTGAVTTGAVTTDAVTTGAVTTTAAVTSG